MCKTHVAFVVPPSFVTASRQQPLWVRAITGLPLHMPDYGGYRQGLVSADVIYGGLVNRAPTWMGYDHTVGEHRFLLAASGSFSQDVCYELSTSGPLSVCNGTCYSPIKAF